MTERFHEFEVDLDAAIELRLGSGDVRIVESAAGVVEITLRGSDRALQNIVVDQRGNTVAVASRKRFGFTSGVDISIAVPRGTRVDAKLASADLVVDVAAGTLFGSVGAGDIKVREVEGDVELHGAAGDIRLGRVGGTAKVAVASGDIRIDRVEGDATIKSGSGDVEVGRLDGRCECKTASGDVLVRNFEGRSFQGMALAGDVVVGLPDGRTLDVLLQTLAGDVRNEFDVVGDEESSGDASLEIKTMSGDITLRSAG